MIKFWLDELWDEYMSPKGRRLTHLKTKKLQKIEILKMWYFRKTNEQKKKSFDVEALDIEKRSLIAYLENGRHRGKIICALKLHANSLLNVGFLILKTLLFVFLIHFMKQ